MGPSASSNHAGLAPVRREPDRQLRLSDTSPELNRGTWLTDLLEPTHAGRRRRRAVAIALWVLAIILVAIAVAWWLNLPDEGPGEPIIKDVAEEASKLGR